MKAADVRENMKKKKHLQKTVNSQDQSQAKKAEHQQAKCLNDLKV